MINAKQEFLTAVGNTENIICAYINHHDKGKFNLKVNHTDKELESFLQEIDFKYDDGYGEQELFGTIWLKNGDWIEREDYDGSEYWVYKYVPNIPKKLRK